MVPSCLTFTFSYLSSPVCYGSDERIRDQLQESFGSEHESNFDIFLKDILVSVLLHLGLVPRHSDSQSTWVFIVAILGHIGAHHPVAGFPSKRSDSGRRVGRVWIRETVKTDIVRSGRNVLVLDVVRMFEFVEKVRNDRNWKVGKATYSKMK